MPGKNKVEKNKAEQNKTGFQPENINSEYINQGRRHSLKALTALSPLALSSCCYLEIRPNAKIKDNNTLRAANNSTQRMLSPDSIQKHSRTPKHCIDVHAHFFNASDVNVKGYVKGPIANSMKTDILRKLVRALAGVVQAIASIAPTAAQEYDDLDTLATGLTALRSSKERTDTLYRRLESKRDTIARELYKEMVKQKVDVIYMQALDEFYEQSGLRSLTRPTFSEDMVREAIDPERRQTKMRSLDTQKTASKLANDPGGVLEFIGHMLGDRWGNLLTYQKHYTTDSGSFGVDAVFSSLVDFDYWLDCIPPSARSDQMKLHSRLSLRSGGYMLPIIAYNPWTDIKHDNESFELVKTAINEYGFIGVKIYPPNGFYAYGNDTISNQTRQPRPKDLTELDNKLEQMFGWCADNKIPVMAHTSQSMGSDNDANLFGGPAGWQALLDKFSNRQNLPIINAGHFGGDETGNNWTEALGALMKTQNGKAFYADVGYWDQLEQCNNPDCTPIQRIQDALNASNNIAKQRIMYGTDWHMSSKEDNWPAYPFLLEHHLKNYLPEFPLDRFFYQNALDCFGLVPGGAQHEKIKARFAGQPGGAPAWFKS